MTDLGFIHRFIPATQPGKPPLLLLHGTGGDEIRQLGGVNFKVGQVEHAFRQPAEERRHAVLRDLAARRQQRRTGRQLRRERNEVVLVAAGAMQEQQRRLAGLRRRDEAVDEAEIGHRGQMLRARTAARALFRTVSIPRHFGCGTMRI